METFSKRVKRLRAELHLTQAQVAERGGCTQCTVDRVEGGADLKFTNAVKLAKGLGVSVDYLAFGDPTEYK